MKTTDQKKLLYLYGISGHGDLGDARLPGVDGISAVEPVPSAGYTCWISRVAADEFGDKLAENMENLDWLGAVGIRHQRVVGAIHERIEMLPARFGTVFRTESSLQEHVREQEPQLKDALARIAGCDEWGVKVFAAERTVAAVEASTGSDYLRQKAVQLARRPAADTEVLELEKALRRVAIEIVPAGKVSGTLRNLVWNGSLLVKRERKKALERVLEDFSGQWGESRRIECTGPWPPYSFVTGSQK